VTVGASRPRPHTSLCPPSHSPTRPRCARSRPIRLEPITTTAIFSVRAPLTSFLRLWSSPGPPAPPIVSY